MANAVMYLISEEAMGSGAVTYARRGAVTCADCGCLDELRKC